MEKSKTLREVLDETGYSAVRPARLTVADVRAWDDDQLESETATRLLGYRPVTPDDSAPLNNYWWVEPDGESWTPELPDVNDPLTAELVRAEIERRDILAILAFMHHLRCLLAVGEDHPCDDWPILNASPADQCRAAILAVQP